MTDSTQQEPLWSATRIMRRLAKCANLTSAMIIFVREGDAYNVCMDIRDEYEAQLATLRQRAAAADAAYTELAGMLSETERERDHWRQQHAHCTTSLITADRQIARLKRERDRLRTATPQPAASEGE